MMGFRCWSERHSRLIDARITRASELIRDAIAQRERLVCLYNAQLFLFCPHLLGYRPDGPYVLAFVVGGDPALGQESVRSPRRWRWIPVADMWGLCRTDGSWHSAPEQTRPPIDDFTPEVEAA
jgi:hypothetical protein